MYYQTKIFKDLIWKRLGSLQLLITGNNGQTSRLAMAWEGWFHASFNRRRILTDTSTWIRYLLCARTLHSWLRAGNDERQSAPCNKSGSMWMSRSGYSNSMSQRLPFLSSQQRMEAGGRYRCRSSCITQTRVLQALSWRRVAATAKSQDMHIIRKTRARGRVEFIGESTLLRCLKIKWMRSAAQAGGTRLEMHERQHLHTWREWGWGLWLRSLWVSKLSRNPFFYRESRLRLKSGGIGTDLSAHAPVCSAEECTAQNPCVRHMATEETLNGNFLWNVWNYNLGHSITCWGLTQYDVKQNRS